MSHHLARAGLAAAATAALLAIPGVALADSCSGPGPIYPFPPVPPIGTVTPVSPIAPIGPTDPTNPLGPDGPFGPNHAKQPVHAKHPGQGTTSTASKSGHKGKTGGKHKKNPTAPVQDNGPTPTTISVSTGKNPHADQPLTLTARLAVGRAHVRGIKAESGTITFVVDGQIGKPIPIKHGRASEKVTLKQGKHTVAADYSGDSGHRPSESAPVTVTLN
jgi:hypothetical protein